MQDTEAGTVDEDWEVLLSFLPQDWRELAQDTGALKGLRKDKAVDNLLRCGCPDPVDGLMLAGSHHDTSSDERRFRVSHRRRPLWECGNLAAPVQA